MTSRLASIFAVGFPSMRFSGFCARVVVQSAMLGGSKLSDVSASEPGAFVTCSRSLLSGALTEKGTSQKPRASKPESR